MKGFKDELIAENLKSKEVYCIHCLTLKEDKDLCCNKSDFESFKHLNDRLRNEIVVKQVAEYQAWSQKQGEMK